MRLQHNDDEKCPLCEEKLKTAHAYLALWFIDLKKRYKTAHVSWAWRGEKDQNQAFNDGASKVRFPNSPHNNLKDDKPCSLALDLFQIIDHKAVFDPVFYAKINSENENSEEPIKWGGKFKGLADYNHFQYEDFSRKDLNV